MKRPLAITGCALLTPLDAAEGGGGGRGTVGNTWQALRAGRQVGAIRAVDEALLDPDTRWDKSLRIALEVAHAASAGKDLGAAQLFCGTSKGPVGIWLEACDRLQKGEPLSELEARQVTLGVGAIGPFLAQRLGIGGRCGGGIHTSVAACASGLQALHRAAQSLWRGECRRALVVAADASLQALFEGSFRRLGVLSPAGTCVPFAEAGSGFFVTEAGAALVLEVAEQGERGTAGPGVLAWLEESWIGGDGTGLVAMDAHTESLRAGLRACAGDRAGRGDLAFVHAHATGTGHDRFEREAIRSVVGNGPQILASKGQLGHSLGAAGLVSVALSVLSHARQETFAGGTLAPGSCSLTIAQGFGGAMGVIRLGGNG